MELKFSGSLETIIAEMVSTLSSLGFHLKPKEDGPFRPFAPQPEPTVIDDDEEDAGIMEKVAEAMQKKVAEDNAVVDLVKKRGGRPKKEAPKPTVADVKAAMEDEDNLNGAREDPDPTEELSEEPSYLQASMDAIALHKLKEETLKRLRDLYISGKGPFVRQLLAKHGHGALVFPEVDAKWFPDIKADMERGLN